MAQQNPKIILLDVREDSEWNAGHAAEAVHLGKGVLERDLEKRIPDVNTEIIMYCGGGYRSVLTCDAAQKMGYRSVHSLIGGYRGMVAAGWPMTKAKDEGRRMNEEISGSILPVCFFILLSFFKRRRIADD